MVNFMENIWYLFALNLHFLWYKSTKQCRERCKVKIQTSCRIIIFSFNKTFIFSIYSLQFIVPDAGVFPMRNVSEKYRFLPCR